MQHFSVICAATQITNSYKCRTKEVVPRPYGWLVCVWQYIKWLEFKLRNLLLRIIRGGGVWIDLQD